MSWISYPWELGLESGLKLRLELGLDLETELRLELGSPVCLALAILVVGDLQPF